MISTAKTPDEYVASLTDDRRQIVGDIRDTINANLPEGYTEGMAYGMISWAVPHSIYPSGYHVDPSKPLGLMGLASQKNYISIYHMGLYAGLSLHEWFAGEWPKHSSKKLDCGKCCLRFKKAEEVPLKLIGELAAKLTPGQWIGIYEQAMKR